MSDTLKPAFLEVTSGHQDSLMLLLGRLDSKVDLLLLRDQQQDERIKALEGAVAVIVPRTEIALLDTRLTALETWRSRALGGWAVLVMLAGLAGNYVINHVWK